MPPITPGSRTKIKRLPKRAVEASDDIKEILDSAFLCHVGYTIDGEARVLPTAYVRVDNAIYLHGHLHNQMLNALLDGQLACISVTLLDGLVLARSGFNHSVNYRSVTVFGRAEQVTGEAKLRLLDRMVDHIVPGRSLGIRESTQQELNATLMVKIPIDEAVAKVRKGPPLDAEKDYETDIWAGTVAIETVPGQIQRCPRLSEMVPIPEHVLAFVRQTHDSD